MFETPKVKQETPKKDLSSCPGSTQASPNQQYNSPTRPFGFTPEYDKEMSILRSAPRNYKILESNITLGGVQPYEHYTGVRETGPFEENFTIDHPAGGLRSTIKNEFDHVCTSLMSTMNVEREIEEAKERKQIIE